MFFFQRRPDAQDYQFVEAQPLVEVLVIELPFRLADLEPHVAARLPARRGGASPDVRAAAIVASALSCLETAQEAWSVHPTARLATLLDQAMAAVAPLPAPGRPA